MNKKNIKRIDYGKILMKISCTIAIIYIIFVLDAKTIGYSMYEGNMLYDIGKFIKMVNTAFNGAIGVVALCILFRNSNEFNGCFVSGLVVDAISILGSLIVIIMIPVAIQYNQQLFISLAALDMILDITYIIGSLLVLNGYRPKE